MQEAFFYLALTNTRRVARLAAAPEGLACWALELVRDAAEAALKFVQDWDSSSLGLGQMLEGAVSEDEVRHDDCCVTTTIVTHYDIHPRAVQRDTHHATSCR